MVNYDNVLHFTTIYRKTRYFDGKSAASCGDLQYYAVIYGKNRLFSAFSP